jgi:hypothetical protein
MPAQLVAEREIDISWFVPGWRSLMTGVCAEPMQLIYRCSVASLSQ